MIIFLMQAIATELIKYASLTKAGLISLDELYDNLDQFLRKEGLHSIADDFHYAYQYLRWYADPEEQIKHSAHMLQSIGKNLLEYGFKQRKRQKVERAPHEPPTDYIPPDVTDNNDEKESENPLHPENNDPPANQAVLKMPFTSFPHSLQCVDLGTVSLDAFGKGGKNGDPFDKQSVDTSNTLVLQSRLKHVTSAADVKKFDFLQDTSTFITVRPTVAGTILPAGTHPRTKPVWNGSGDQVPAAFNSIAQLSQIRENLFFQTGATASFNDPVYPTSAGASVTDPNDAHQLVAIANQSIILRLKNISQESNDPSHCFITIKAYQATRDIYTTKDGGGVYFSPHVDLLTNGFQQAVNNKPKSFGTTINSPPNLTPYADSKEQPLLTPWKDNVWLEKNFKQIHSKTFCLCIGQEAVMKYKLTKPQIMSYQYLLKSRVIDNNAALPIMMKKGEIQFLISYEGGLQAGFTTTDNLSESNVVQGSKVQLVGFMQVKYDAYRIMDYKRDYQRKFKQETKPTTVSALDIDIGAFQ